MIRIVIAAIVVLGLLSLSCGEGETDPTLVNVWLRWTATGDDGDQGCAMTYQLCISSVPLSYPINTNGKALEAWPVTVCAGLPDSVEVKGLTADQAYWFTLRVQDDGGNWSGWSNIVTRIMLDVLAPATIEDLHFADGE